MNTELEPDNDDKPPVKGNLLTDFDKQFENVNEMFREMNYDPLRNMASSSNFIGQYLHTFCDLNEEMRVLSGKVQSNEITPDQAQTKFDVHIDKVARFIKLRTEIDATAVKYYKPSKKPEEQKKAATDPADELPMVAPSFRDLHTAGVKESEMNDR